MEKPLSDEDIKKKEEEIESMNANCDDLTEESKMIIKSLGVEQVYWLLRKVGEGFDFKRKFRVTLDYDPESLNATVKFYR
mgnify:CR=1 FL=1